jgi:hypothetical protein
MHQEVIVESPGGQIDCTLPIRKSAYIESWRARRAL